KLVDTYNELLATLNGKLTETRYKDYLPLTDTQKADLNMTDSETLMWTAKAQSGLLRNDSTITALVTAMRNAISYPVNGAKGIYNTAASIGITTGAYQEGGKLYLDTTRLTNALTADPGVLNELFSLDDGDTQKGIATRMYEGLASMMTRIESIAGTPATATADLKSSLALTITSYTDRITQATTRFSTLQTQYYTRFNAMEVALQSLSAQSSWISSLFVTE
ncbi:MAG: flagellar filament capping protein FliD, partial [Peptococcaceae bacterium]|nr:flagellar filament capping protein FliD [Peptococcaceae bacterium]